MKTYKLTVTLTANCTRQEAKEYVADAVNAWGGGSHPTDPFFGENKTVKITHVRKPTPKK